MEEDIKILEELLNAKITVKLSPSDYGWKAIEHLIKGYKELEEEIKKINKQLDLDYVDKNYIPVSLVEEKIEELWIKCPKNSINRFMINERNNKIAVLQELLEKRK